MNAFVYHAGLYAASAALLKLGGFVLFLWLAKAMSVKDYAAWGLLYALQIWIASSGMVGIVEAVVALLKSHRAPDAQHRLFSSANASFLVTCSVTVTVAGVFFAILPTERQENVGAIAWTLVSGAFLSYSTLQAQLVRLQERHLASLYFNFVIPCCGLAGSAAAFSAEHSVASFFAGSALGLALAMVPAVMVRLGHAALDPNPRHCRPILSRIGPFIVVTFLGWLGGYGNTYIIGYFFSDQEIAKFTLVFMASSIMQMVATAMNQVWSPRFYNVVHDAALRSVEARSRKVLRWQGIALGAVAALLTGAFPFAAALIGGNLRNYGTATTELFLLTLAYITLVPYWHAQNHLLVHDKGNDIMRLHLWTGAIGVVVLAFLVLLLGPLGVYVGFLVQMMARSAGAVVVARRYWQIGTGWDAVLVGLLIAAAGLIAIRWLSLY